MQVKCQTKMVSPSGFYLLIIEHSTYNVGVNASLILFIWVSYEN